MSKVRLWAGLALAAFATLANADSFPSRSIRIIVPFPPGGGTDIIAREIAQRIAAATTWTFVIENRPGAGGNVGVDAAAKASPDGYTLVLGQTSNLAVNPTLYPRLPYDPIKDLAPIALVASAPLVMVVPASSPYRSLADLVAAAKAAPGSINFASPGNGTVAHLSGELFQKVAGVKFVHVPYKGAAQGLTDLMGGRVQVYLSSVPTLIGQIKQGHLRPLAVTSPQRVADLPEVPTMAEAGFKGVETATWFGFAAPAGTPKDVIAQLNARINAALALPQTRERLRAEGATPMGGTPEQFGALIKAEIARWGRIVKDAGVRLE